MNQMEENIGFDFKVTHRDQVSGAITQNPYTTRFIKNADGSKYKIYERPVGSGNLWDAAGKPNGRWVNGKHEKNAEHIKFARPETKDQQLARSVTEKDVKIAMLEKELAAIKSEAASPDVKTKESKK